MTLVAGEKVTRAAGGITPREVAPTARLVLSADASPEEWHDVRRSGIGGSDVAAILGLDRYRGPRHVYEAKHGLHTVESEPMRWGRRLEQLIAEAFAEESGVALAADSPGTLAHEEQAWRLANVDRLAVDGDGRVLGPVECKNRSAYQLADWEGEEPPDAPAIQTHWYMGVGGWAWGWTAALVGGNRLRWYRLRRDEELLEHLVDYCGRWWQRHIVESVPPPPDGSQATAELLAHLWDAQPEAVAEVDVLWVQQLIERHRTLTDQRKALEEQLRLVEAELKTALGDAEIARVGARTAYTWKANGTFRAGAFRAEQPELAAEYTRLAPVVDTERLAADHPEIYRRYRARVLRIPKGES